MGWNFKWQWEIDEVTTAIQAHPSRDRQTKLIWLALEHVDCLFSLVEHYKIVFGMNKLNFEDLFEFTKCNSTRANHPYKLYAKPAKCNPYKYFPPVRIVRDRNSLPGSIIEAGSLICFKSALKHFLNIHLLFVSDLIHIFVDSYLMFYFICFHCT